MKEIKQIIKTVQEQREALTGARCTSEYCSGTCHVCAARRRARQIERDAIKVEAYIEQLKLASKILQESLNITLCQLTEFQLDKRENKVDKG